MKKFRLAGTGAVALAAVILTGSALAAGATAARVVPFSAKYSGTASAKVTQQVADIVANGTGTGLLIGAGTITGHGSGDSSVQPCVPFTGPGSMVGTKGKLLFTVISGSQGCGDEGGHIFSVVGHAKVRGVSGKLAKARGTLKFTGVFDRDQGTFSIKFSGSLTV